MSKEEQRPTSPTKTQPSPNEVFVKNFPFSSTAQEIGEFFEDCGDVVNVNVLRDRRGRSKGIAFVKFNDTQSAQKALAKNNADLGGRPLVVETAAPRDQRPPKPQREGGFREGGFREGGNREGGFREGGHREGGHREGGNREGDSEVSGSSVFIGNLSYDTTEEALRDLFKGLGEVKTVRVAKGQDGRPRGFAHIDFADAEAAKEAVKKSGTELDGRQIRVDFSSGGRPNNGGGFRGGRGGFGGGSRGGSRGGFGGRGTRGGSRGGFGGRGTRGGFRGAPREGGFREGGNREGGFRGEGAPREGGFRGEGAPRAN